MLCLQSLKLSSYYEGQIMEERFDKTYNDNDDFNFNLDENSELDTSVFEQKNSKRSGMNAFGKYNFKNIFWLFLIAAILMFFAVYKIYGIIFEPKKNVEIITKPKEPATVTTKVEATTLPAVVTTDTSPKQNSVQVNQETLNEMSVLTNKVESLTSTVSTLQETVSELTTQLKNQDEKLQTLENKLVTPKNDVTKKVHAKPIRKINQALLMAKFFHIQSIIPGRAWLIDEQGRNYSVTVGNSVPYIGKVRMIDPIKGLVIMNSGAIIRYRD